MFIHRGMTVIPVFWSRILLTPRRTTFICDQIRPQSLLAPRTGCEWENWILKAYSESNPERLTSAATKENRNSHVEIGRESPRISEDHCWRRSRVGHANFRTCSCLLQNDRHPGRSNFVCG